MKFDMGRAWNDAVALLRANGQVVAIVAGAFFFLPYLVLMMLMPSTLTGVETRVAGEADADAALQAAWTLYGEIWWQLLLVSVITAIGMLGLLALLTDRGRPTVGEALKSGVTYFLPYVASQLLLSLTFVIVAIIPIMVAAAAGASVGVLLGVVAAIAIIYLYVKFCLTVPVIVIDKVANPLRALGRSWGLTKGNSVRLFLFFLLLLVALLVIALVIGLVVGLIGALAGPSSAIFISSLVNSAINALGITVYLAVLAAIHRQLSGSSPVAATETFN